MNRQKLNFILLTPRSSDGTARISQPNEIEATVLEHYPNEINKQQSEASNGNCGISDRYAVTSIVWKVHKLSRHK